MQGSYNYCSDLLGTSHVNILCAGSIADPDARLVNFDLMSCIEMYALSMQLQYGVHSYNFLSNSYIIGI